MHLHLHLNLNFYTAAPAAQESQNMKMNEFTNLLKQATADADAAAARVQAQELLEEQQIADLNDQVTQLKTQLDAATNVPPEVVAQVTALDQKVTAVLATNANNTAGNTSGVPTNPDAGAPIGTTPSTTDAGSQTDAGSSQAAPAPGTDTTGNGGTTP